MEPTGTPSAADTDPTMSASRPVIPPSPEAELAARISHDLRAKMALVRELGRSFPDATSELCQAALNEAEGRESEALETLRGAQARLEHEIDELLQQRIRATDERREALAQIGVRFSLGNAWKELADDLAQGRRDEVAVTLLEAERRVAQFESDWKGIQGLLAQIEGLKTEAADLGLPLGEISSELEGIRDRLEAPNLTEESLDEVAQAAAQTLMLLHESIPSSLEDELQRHAVTLDRFPEEHVPSAVARRLHVEASRHLKKGRLPEAVQSVRELRQQIEAIEQDEADGVGQLPAPPTPGVRETEAETLDRLLKKARSLAARVRTLPPDSETAREAAIEIRTATELLKTRELSEADQTLARLMRMLAAEGARE
jgi:phytoene dehydrogenase-like protein